MEVLWLRMSGNARNVDSFCQKSSVLIQLTNHFVSSKYFDHYKLNNGTNIYSSCTLKCLDYLSPDIMILVFDNGDWDSEYKIEEYEEITKNKRKVKTYVIGRNYITKYFKRNISYIGEERGYYNANELFN